MLLSVFLIFWGNFSGFPYFLELLLRDRVSQVNTEQLTERGNQKYGKPEIFKNLSWSTSFQLIEAWEPKVWKTRNFQKSLNIKVKISQLVEIT